MRFIFILALIGLLVPVFVPQAQAQGARFDYDGCNPANCAESGWIFDDSSSPHTTVWRHDLGATPRAISILFSPDPAGRRVMPVMWNHQYQYSGNPVSIEMGRRAVHLHIFNGIPLHGIWKPEGGWTTWTEGYWKIMVYR